MIEAARAAPDRPALLLIDNIDSFTHLLADRLHVAGATSHVVRHHDVTVEEALAGPWDGLVVSPGPGRPEQAGISVALTRAAIAARRPLLGVCLGHQALALACGSKVEQVAPVHGKVGLMRHDGDAMFAGIVSPTPMTRYHSLCVIDPAPPLIPTAWSEEGILMAMRHQSAPAWGVQFHPESIGSRDGITLLANFVALAARSRA